MIVVVQLCKAKYTNLRTYYRKERIKVNRTRSGGAANEVYKPSWPYYEELHFLAPTVDVDDATLGSTIPGKDSQPDTKQVTICTVGKIIFRESPTSLAKPSFIHHCNFDRRVQKQFKYTLDNLNQ